MNHSGAGTQMRVVSPGMIVPPCFCRDLAGNLGLTEFAETARLKFALMLLRYSRAARNVFPSNRWQLPVLYHLRDAELSEGNLAEFIATGS
jgi:hypothetical protein